MTKYNVYAFDLNSLYNDKVGQDITIGNLLSLEDAIKLRNETQTNDIASWITKQCEICGYSTYACVCE